MSPEKMASLLQEFPDLYSHDSFKRYGLSCGDGWYLILRQLSKKISSLDSQARAIQVKNKFGGLRYYLEFGPGAAFSTSSPSYEAIRQAIGEAEDQSFITCEICGAPGDNQGMRIRCSQHINDFPG